MSRLTSFLIDSESYLMAAFLHKHCIAMALCTGLLKMVVGVLTVCHTQYT